MKGLHILDKAVPLDVRRAVTGLKYLLECLSRLTDQDKTNILRSIQCKIDYPCFPDDTNFFTWRFQKASLADVQVKRVGSLYVTLPKYLNQAVRIDHFTILFHQNIHIPNGSTRIRIHLESSRGLPRVFVIDKDSGRWSYLF